jgi:hypothetical protein
MTARNALAQILRAIYHSCSDNTAFDGCCLFQVAVGFFYDQSGMRGQMQAVQAQPMAELVHDVTIGS